MPDRQQTSLKFPLEETLWFEKGQEVEDLISISLDPQITVVDEDDFVVLRGTLELSGEYNHSPESDAIGAFPVPGRTFVQTVEVRNDGQSEFSHHFPVDITIPKQRVADLNEIEIEVHSFDYVLPDQSSLKILADIFVHGIYDEYNNSVHSENEEGDPVNITERPEIESPSFPQYTAIEEQAVEDEVDEEVEIELVHHSNDENIPSAPDSVIEREDDQESIEAATLFEEEEGQDEEEEQDEEEKQQEENRSVNEDVSEQSKEDEIESIEVIHHEEQIEVKMEESEEILVRDNSTDEDDEWIDEDLYESFSAEARIVPQQDQKESDDHNSGLQLSQLPKLTLEPIGQSVVRSEKHPEVESSATYYGEQESSSVHEEESSHSPELEKSKKKKKKGKYQTISFADFFARKESDSSTKMRVCIVQQGDSIQSLADKYEISVQQILRANHLDASHEVYEGQVLHIPDKSMKPKISEHS